MNLRIECAQLLTPTVLWKEHIHWNIYFCKNLALKHNFLAIALA